MIWRLPSIGSGEVHDVDSVFRRHPVELPQEPSLGLRYWRIRALGGDEAVRGVLGDPVHFFDVVVAIEDGLVNLFTSLIERNPVQSASSSTLGIKDLLLWFSLFVAAKSISSAFSGLGLGFFVVSNSEREREGNFKFGLMREKNKNKKKTEREATSTIRQHSKHRYGIGNFVPQRSES